MNIIEECLKILGGERKLSEEQLKLFDEFGMNKLKDILEFSENLIQTELMNINDDPEFGKLYGKNLMLTYQDELHKKKQRDELNNMKSIMFLMRHNQRKLLKTKYEGIKYNRKILKPITVTPIINNKLSGRTVVIDKKSWLKLMDNKKTEHQCIVELNHDTYCLVCDYHQEDKHMIYVSEKVYNDLLDYDGNMSDDISMVDSHIESIKELTLRLLYKKRENDYLIDDDKIANLMINDLSNLKILNVGDIIKIDQYEYMIISITNTKNHLVRSGKINHTDVLIKLEIETKNELIKELMKYKELSLNFIFDNEKLDEMVK